MKIFNRGVQILDALLGLRIGGGQVLPTVNVRTAGVSAKTSNYTVLVSELNSIFTNTGASGTVVFTLPSVRSSAGATLKLTALAAQIIRATPASGEAVNLNGSAVTDKYLNIAATIGNYADLYCDGRQWIVTTYSGVVTKEA